jgi:membrane protease YdiL (CAAX protease family)
VNQRTGLPGSHPINSMNDEPPSGSHPQYVRVRTQPFWWPWVLAVTLLYAGMVWLIRSGETELFGEHHGALHYEHLETSLHLLEYYEQEPPAVRWLSGYFSSAHIYRETSQIARAAEADGYLTASARQAMASLALYMKDIESAAYWRDGQGPGKLPGENVAALLQLTAAPPLPISAIIEYSGGTYKPGAGAAAYWQIFWLSGSELFIFIVLLPCAWRLTQSFRSAHGQPAAPVSPVIQAWRPSTMCGGWLTAEFLFGFGGLALTAAPIALHFSEYAQWDFSLPSPVAAVFLALGKISLFLAGAWYGDIIFLLLAVLPVVLMCRWFAGGLRGATHLFGLHPVAGGWKKAATAALGGIWFYLAVSYLIHLIQLLLPWMDPRDGWRFSNEELWRGILFGVIVAPLVEEFIFRGFLFKAFCNRWRPLTAAAISSVIFAVVHGYSLPGTVSIALFGMICCALYHRTGSLWSSIILHSLWNLWLTCLGYALG